MFAKHYCFTVLSATMKGWHAEVKWRQPQFFANREEFSTQPVESLCRGDRLVIPMLTGETVLDDLHESHVWGGDEAFGSADVLVATVGYEHVHNGQKLTFSAQQSLSNKQLKALTRKLILVAAY